MQKIPAEQNNSFVVQTIFNQQVDTACHQHMEYELILITQGSGITYIGNYIGRFEAGDIYLIGSNLQHSFQMNSHQLMSAVEVRFKDNCWGNYFLNIPECKEIKQLCEIAVQGIQIIGNTKHLLQPLVKALEKATFINRIILLLQCLHNMAAKQEYIILSKKKAQRFIHDRQFIDSVIEFTLASFQNRISLSKVATVACMSIPSFCYHFKRQTQKTYIDYLNEIRISYASRQLLETNKPIIDICYESGYNTVAHFHRKFLKLKKQTPLQFRKSYSMKMNHPIDCLEIVVP